MLHEMVVRNLGVISEASLVLGPGLTALTGETGAGKTLVTEAVSLLTGGRADPALVRTGASEAEVEGRFVFVGTDPDGGVGEIEEVVVRRVIPATGRSRAYIDGRLATAGAIADAVGDLIDLHGQHGQQSLLHAAARRGAVDRFGDIDASPLADARFRLRQAMERLDQFGGDARARAREIELLRFQLDELCAAGIDDADEDDLLREQESLLGDAQAHREAAEVAASLLGVDGLVGDGLAQALVALRDRAPFTEHTARLHSVIAEITDLSESMRGDAEMIADDPGKLAEVGARRQVLAELRRKYGATLAEVISYRDELATRLDDLESFDERAAALDAEIDELRLEVADEAARLGAARRKIAPTLASLVEQRLRDLALPNAAFQIDVGDDPGDNIEFLVAMNPGAPMLSIARAASGGELSRIMLALQLVVAEAPPTVIFDEIDAGVGGEAATSIGRALADVSEGRQVLVVTHLAQVAAFADHQVNIEKSSDGDGATTTLTRLDDAGRVVELSRMLSGSPDSEAARRHARELLDAGTPGRENTEKAVA